MRKAAQTLKNYKPVGSATAKHNPIYRKALACALRGFRNLSKENIQIKKSLCEIEERKNKLSRFIQSADLMGWGVRNREFIKEGK